MHTFLVTWIMAGKPTYETEGEIPLFDERDTVFSREAYMPGSPEEREYHERHPEKREVDERLTRFILSKMEESADGEHLARAVYEAHFLTSAALALPDQSMASRPASASSGIRRMRRGGSRNSPAPSALRMCA